jgi:hypothetical protein
VLFYLLSLVFAAACLSALTAARILRWSVWFARGQRPGFRPTAADQLIQLFDHKLR